MEVPVAVPLWGFLAQCRFIYELEMAILKDYSTRVHKQPFLQLVRSKYTNRTCGYEGRILLVLATKTESYFKN